MALNCFLITLDQVFLGRKNPNPKFKFYKKYESAYLLDANNGFGLAAGSKAIDKGMQVAKKKGMHDRVKNSSLSRSISKHCFKSLLKKVL